MRVLLISTYELGHQPLHVAAAAAELQAAGHDVVALDLAVDSWDPARLTGVGAVAISVPMHTALRLGIETARRVRRDAPQIPIALYGLYAGVGAEATRTVVDRQICGEYEDALIQWVAAIGGPSATGGVSVDIGPRKFRTPARHVLPGLDRYAHLATSAGHQLVGYVEASHGCRHRCAHCPVPAVYDGRYRITGEDTVLADMSQLVEAGAGHITFGDPDFLNAPAYSIRVLEAAHDRFPDVSFDVTVKVEHLLAHRDLLGRLADARVVFVVSAVETLDDSVLRRLQKGHTAADADRAVDLVQAAGIDVHPTWLPFTPWTTPQSVADIARFIWEHDLAPVTDPVQLTIRLLIPDGSLMLQIPDLDPYLTRYDGDSLGYSWSAADPSMARLQGRLAAMAEQGAAHGDDPIATLAEMTAVIADAAGVEIPTPMSESVDRPRLTEPWFCCSEPTGIQLAALDG
ncbi:MAG TPA: CUAEP/CCAEP-tail radical SAM protein [Acidimicrobiia bacterium]|nr:CUAEP/CCAEP-tail radical SAM protein [Acidimicrobiia bacterium]